MVGDVPPWYPPFPGFAALVPRRSVPYPTYPATAPFRPAMPRPTKPCQYEESSRFAAHLGACGNPREQASTHPVRRTSRCQPHASIPTPWYPSARMSGQGDHRAQPWYCAGVEGGASSPAWPVGSSQPNSPRPSDGGTKQSPVGRPKRDGCLTIPTRVIWTGPVGGCSSSGAGAVRSRCQTFRRGQPWQGLVGRVVGPMEAPGRPRRPTGRPDRSRGVTAARWSGNRWLERGVAG